MRLYVGLYVLATINDETFGPSIIRPVLGGYVFDRLSLRLVVFVARFID